MRQQPHCISVSFRLSLNLWRVLEPMYLFCQLSFMIYKLCNFWSIYYYKVYFYILTSIKFELCCSSRYWYWLQLENSSHKSLISTNSLPLVFILALCIRIHVYTIHSLTVMGWLQYFLKQHMSIFLCFKKLGREVGVQFCHLV